MRTTEPETIPSWARVSSRPGVRLSRAPRFVIRDVRNGFDGIKVTYDIDADATSEEIEAVVAQSQKRSAVYDLMTNPTNVTVEVN